MLCCPIIILWALSDRIALNRSQLFEFHVTVLTISTCGCNCYLILIWRNSSSFDKITSLLVPAWVPKNPTLQVFSQKVSPKGGFAGSVVLRKRIRTAFFSYSGLVEETILISIIKQASPEYRERLVLWSSSCYVTLYSNVFLSSYVYVMETLSELKL